MESLLFYGSRENPNTLFHGSTTELKIGDYLEPFESKLLNGEKAVFATNNIVCAMALAHKKMPEDYVFDDHVEIGFDQYGFHIKEISALSLKPLYDTKAFIYLVHNESFKSDSRLGMQNHEFISKERVKIEKVISISNLWSDLKALAYSKTKDGYSLVFTTNHIYKLFHYLKTDEKSNESDMIYNGGDSIRGKSVDIHNYADHLTSQKPNNNNSNNNILGTAKRFDTGKPRFSLIPPAPLEEIAKVLTMGAEKYGDRNWEKGMKWTRCIDSLERHLNAFKKGETLDKESGLPHLAHVCVNSMFLLQYEKTYPQGDDRK